MTQKKKYGVEHVCICDKFVIDLWQGRWFFLGTTVFSTNKTERYDTTEILLKVALSTINLNKPICDNWSIRFLLTDKFSILMQILIWRIFFIRIWFFLSSSTRQDLIYSGSRLTLYIILKTDSDIPNKNAKILKSHQLYKIDKYSIHILLCKLLFDFISN